MKAFLLSILSQIILLLSASTGFAYLTWSNGDQGGCRTCHPEGSVSSAGNSQLHAIDDHMSNCANCHIGTPAVGTVPPSACILCHPLDGPNGLCALINAPSHTTVSASCKVCHDACIPASTTTTAPDNATTTTTSAPVTSTTTTAVLTITPDEVTVDGSLDQSIAITITLSRPGLGSLTTADLRKLEVTVSEPCSTNISINMETVDFESDNDSVRVTVTITVDGDAPSSACEIRVADPEGIASPPLDSTAVFTITSTLDCQIQSISPDFVRVGFGLLPRIRMFTITASRDLQEAGISQADLSFAQLSNAMLLNAQVSGDQIRALVLFWGTQPGIYAVELGPCGSIPVEVVRFF